MTGVLITFQYDETSFDPQRIEGVAEGARPAFEGMPELRFKAFTVDEANRRAVNFYLWDSEDAARAFFGEEVRQRVTGLYGVPPTIDFLEVAVFVDNGVAPAAA
jgi:hypothetical protein